MIQFEGEAVPALVVLCTAGSTKHQAFLMIASARGFGRGGVPSRSRDLRTRVRSLGPAVPLLQQYGKSAELLQGAGSRLLDAVAFPGRQIGVQGPEGTFVPDDACAVDTSSVPLNLAQRGAVLGLTGGLDIIVGPPGIVSLSQQWYFPCRLSVDAPVPRGWHFQGVSQSIVHFHFCFRVSR